MRALLTSSGVKNASIRDALVNLLGKPIAESTALFIPTAIYPFGGGSEGAWRALTGRTASPLCELGWKSLGILELSVLPSIERDAWVPTVEAADALLVWGGDPVFLAGWLRRSGLAELLPQLRPESVYVGVSGGSMAACASFAETYLTPPAADEGILDAREIVFAAPAGPIRRTLVEATGAGLVDFAVIPHLEHPDHPDAALANARRWAAHNRRPTYAIDDQSAVRVIGGAVDVVSEGNWRLLHP